MQIAQSLSKRRDLHVIGAKAEMKIRTKFPDILVSRGNDPRKSCRSINGRPGTISLIRLNSSSGNRLKCRSISL